MPTLSSPSPLLDESASVVVDWNRLSTIVTGGHRQANVDDVVDWIKTSPLRSQLRVHLRQSGNDHSSKQLRRTLQSLGCRVTALTSFVVSDR